MITHQRQGAAGALLDIYEEAITSLKELISDIPDHALQVIADPQTSDENCRSIKAILSHVVSCAYGYAAGISGLKGHSTGRPDKVFRSSIREYQQDLSDAFSYTESVFRDIDDSELEQSDNSLKIQTIWGQLYDIEQMTEHAIVHILRHKRQIGNIKRKNLG